MNKIIAKGLFEPQLKDLPRYTRTYFITAKKEVLVFSGIVGYIPLIMISFDPQTILQDCGKVYITTEKIAEYLPEWSEQLEELKQRALKDTLYKEAA